MNTRKTKTSAKREAKPRQDPSAKPHRGSTNQSTKTGEPVLTHLEKIFWKESGLTKGDLIRYYEEISPVLLPHLKMRPETLLRYPSGVEGDHFYQRNLDAAAPEWLSSCIVVHEGKEHRYLVVNTLEDLLYAINLGCVDLHPWSCSVDHWDAPDYMVLDLDPEKIAFKAVVEVAQAFHDLLEPLGIPHVCKTSGATGLHIYLPLERLYTYAQSREMARHLCEQVHQRLPKITTLERSLAKRAGTVYLDYVQNSFSHSLAAVYCVRPRPGAPVSTPLHWEEVRSDLNPLSWTMETTPARIRSEGDLFAPVLQHGKDLHKLLKKLECPETK